MGHENDGESKLVDALKIFYEQLCECRSIKLEILETYRNDPCKAETTFDAGFSWVRFYTVPFLELVRLYAAYLCYCEGAEAGSASDESTDLLRKYLPEVLDLDSPDDGNQYQVGIYMAIANNLECMELHGKPLNRMLEEYSNNRSVELLKKIIKFDRATIAHPYIARDIALAELTGNVDVYHHLKLGLSGSRSKKDRFYADLRYLLVLLGEMGLLNHLSGEAKYQLFCVELGVYPVSGSDPKKGLERQIQRIQSEWAT